MTWDALQVGRRVEFVIEETGIPGLFGLRRTATVLRRSNDPTSDWVDLRLDALLENRDLDVVRIGRLDRRLGWLSRSVAFFLCNTALDGGPRLNDPIAQGSVRLAR